jgi:hypothetical protein
MSLASNANIWAGKTASRQALHFCVGTDRSATSKMVFGGQIGEIIDDWNVTERPINAPR